MARPLETLETEQRRQRAFDRYLSGNRDGTRPSLRQIAIEFGVTHRAVQNWKERDRWDERVRAALDLAVRTSNDAARDLAIVARDTLKRQITILRDMSQDLQLRPRDRIMAVNA